MYVRKEVKKKKKKKKWKWSLVLLPTICVQCVMPTFTFPAKPIALTGFVVSSSSSIFSLSSSILSLSSSILNLFVFSANCIMLVWQHGSGTSACKCPLCRRPISLLVPTEHSLRQRDDPEVAQIFSKIHAYNRVFGGQPSSFFQVPILFLSSFLPLPHTSAQFTPKGHCRDCKIFPFCCTGCCGSSSTLTDPYPLSSVPVSLLLSVSSLFHFITSSTDYPFFSYMLVDFHNTHNLGFGYLCFLCVVCVSIFFL